MVLTQVRRERLLLIALRLFIIGVVVCKVGLAGAGQTPEEIVAAAYRGDLETVKRLVKEGADVNVRDEEHGATSLVAAAYAGHPSVVEYLLEVGGDPKLTETKYGATPMMAATFAGNHDVVEILKRHKAQMSQKRRAAQAARQDASDKRKAESDLSGDNTVPLASPKDMDLELVDAALEGDVQKVTCLLSQGADANARDPFGLTALTRAAIEGHMGVAELLLAHGADANAAVAIRTGSQFDLALDACLSALSCALLNNRPPAQTGEGAAAEEDLTPLQAAKKAGHRRVVEVLRKYGASR